MQEIVFIVAVSALVLFYGAKWGRMDGGGGWSTPEWVERTAVMLPFVAACVPWAGWWAVLAYAGVVGIATGHGQYFLDLKFKFISAEKIDPFVRIFFGRDPRTQVAPGALASAIYRYGINKLYWRNVFGMYVLGTLVGLPSAILAASFGHWLFAGLFLLTGVSKAVAYMAGEKWGSGTKTAEWVNGTLRTATALAVFWSFVLI